MAKKELPSPIAPIDAKAEEINSHPGVWAEMKIPFLMIDPEKLAQLRKIYDEAQRKKPKGEPPETPKKIGQ